LKSIVDSARKNKNIYLEDKEEGVNRFRRDVNHAILSVSKFCSPRDVHYERMLVSLYTFASCAEGFFYHFIKRKMSAKYEEYDKIPVKGILDIIQILNVNLENNYVYSSDTRVIVVDTNQKIQKEIELDEDIIEIVNAAPQELKGLLLYNFYTGYGENEDIDLSGDDFDDESEGEIDHGLDTIDEECEDCEGGDECENE